MMITGQNQQDRVRRNAEGSKGNRRGGTASARLENQRGFACDTGNLVRLGGRPDDDRRLEQRAIADALQRLSKHGARPNDLEQVLGPFLGGNRP